MSELYEIVVEQQLAGQQCVNRFNYVMEGTPVGVTGSFALLQALPLVGNATTPPFGTAGFAFLWNACIANSVVWIQSIAKNIYNVLDFYTYAYLPDTQGSLTGSVHTPAIAFGLTSERVRQDIRRGQKRLAGVRLQDVNTVGDVAAAPLINLTAFGAAMGSAVSYTDGGNNLSFTPTVVHKQKYTTPGGTEAYRYFADKNTQLANVASGGNWFPKTTVRTQGSRQYGRGS